MLTELESENKRTKLMVKAKKARQRAIHPKHKPVSPKKAKKMDKFFAGISQSIKQKSHAVMEH